jgi:hypothetical protein
VAFALKNPGAGLPRISMGGNLCGECSKSSPFAEVKVVLHEGDEVVELSGAVIW